MQVKEEAIDKILAIEQEANRDCKPIFSERAQLISKIPSFWKFVLLQHWLLETLITDEDQEVLDYLEQVLPAHLIKSMPPSRSQLDIDCCTRMRWYVTVHKVIMA